MSFIEIGGHVLDAQQVVAVAVAHGEAVTSICMTGGHRITVDMSVKDVCEHLGIKAHMNWKEFWTTTGASSNIGV